MTPKIRLVVDMVRSSEGGYTVTCAKAMGRLAACCGVLLALPQAARSGINFARFLDYLAHTQLSTNGAIHISHIVRFVAGVPVP